MAAELIRFLLGALAILLPGVLLARWLRAGQSLVEQSAYGSTLGLALAVYLASLVSHFNLHWFYPLWAAVAVVCAIGCWRGGPRGERGREATGQWESWLLVVLLIVGVIRFWFVLPELLPDGWDPAFHMILARKIQLTQHAIRDWRPFADVPLNYPIGSHLLIVILSALSGLGLPTVFKDLIPLLGVLTTAQIYVLGRRMTGSAAVGLYSAAAYGLWAWTGSADYFRWGGLPNQLGMLLFLPVLSLWMEEGHAEIRIALMALLYAAVVLVHHHVMVVSGAVLLVALVAQMIRRTTAPSWKILALALAAAAVLDSFYLGPYAMRAATLGSTRMVQLGERVLDLAEIPMAIGYLMFVMALIGGIFWWRGRLACHPLAAWAVATMAVMFIGCEYIWPPLRRSRGLAPSTVFTPSRFLSDANYFLVIFAALPVAYLQKRRQLPTVLIIVLMLVGATTQIGRWMAAPAGEDRPPTAQFIADCGWIAANTSPSTIVDNLEPPMNTRAWGPYLTWRRCTYVPIPASEPQFDMNAVTNHVNGILAGQIAPDSPDMRIIRLTRQDEMLQLWPISKTGR
jgi:hypothetical protein